MRTLYTALFCLLTASITLQAQQLDHRLGYILVQLKKGTTVESVLANSSSLTRGTLKQSRIISKRLGIYLVEFDHARVHEGHLLDQMRADKNVSIAQYDHLPTLRTVPNDPLFDSQWQWINFGQTNGTFDADIDIEGAWNLTQGGVTAAGDTIVVAIIDDGLDYNHQDIAANAWINHHEIEGNGIDDDDNGYVDDRRGWNAYSDSPEVWNDDHGLAVAGMVGAVGNNNIGIAGVNWNVKLMTIVGGSPESSAIASYAYALEQRIQYNETNGEKGAFVVATNSSWGVDFGQPADAPLWCAFYDSLGAHGILSAAATANLKIDIDVAGDLPTACPSAYLLSVTSLTHNDELSNAAYGLTQIDFGAPGRNIFSTARNNSYETTSGTSFASPIAAGAVALLYAAPFPALGDLMHSDPSAAALLIRDFIFQGVRPIEDLESTIRFGGSINLTSSMDLMEAYFSPCPFPFDILIDNISQNEATIRWSIDDTVQTVNVRYKPMQALTWDTLLDVIEPLVLTNLIGCSEYQIEFQSQCQDTTTDFEAQYLFSTSGCCDIPSNIVTTIEDSNVLISWNEVLAADFFVVQWRPENTTEWFEEATATNQIAFNDLDACQYYEIRVQTICSGTETAFSDITTIRTLGCGNCIDLTYCSSFADNSSEEYIDSLIIGSLVNHSGQNGGYAFYENLNPAYAAGKSYPIWIRSAFPGGNSSDENFRIWLDVNQDGEFEEDELLLDTVLFETELLLSSQLSIPPTALEGSTRMRVSMAFSNPFFPIPQAPCGPIDFGEVEDYCVTILRNPDPCPSVDTVYFDGINFSSAFMYWPETEGAIAYTFRWREEGTDEYQELATIDTTANLDDLEKCKTYEVQIRTICFSDTTSYGFNYLLKTDCDVAADELPSFLSSFNAFPNPATDFISVRLQPIETGDHTVSIYNMQGQRIRHQILYAESNDTSEVRFDQLDTYPSGLYFVVVVRNGLTATRKIVKL